MSRAPVDCAIVYTERGLEIVTAPEVPRRASLMKRRHAEAVLEKLLADPVAREFGPGATV